MPRKDPLTEGDIQLLRQQPIFKDLEPSLFFEMIESTYVMLADKNQVLFQAGDKADYFFVITDGAVRLFQLGLDGEEITVNIFRSQQSFGEAAFFLEYAYPVMAESILCSRLICVSGTKIIERLKQDSHLALGMLASMSQHLKLLVDEITLLRTPTVVRRVAEFLVRLSPTQSGAAEFDLPYNKVIIAKRLGITPETLSRAFLELRTFGVRVERKRVQIDDIMSLLKLSL